MTLQLRASPCSPDVVVGRSPGPRPGGPHRAPRGTLLARWLSEVTARCDLAQSNESALSREGSVGISLIRPRPPAPFTGQHRSGRRGHASAPRSPVPAELMLSRSVAWPPIHSLYMLVSMYFLGVSLIIRISIRGKVGQVLKKLNSCCYFSSVKKKSSRSYMELRFNLIDKMLFFIMLIFQLSMPTLMCISMDNRAGFTSGAYSEWVSFSFCFNITVNKELGDFLNT